MLKDNLYKYSQKCGLSNRLQIKSKLIIELLGEVSDRFE